jgi:5-methylcytosine-specific restriction endonuclease McrA
MRKYLCNEPGCGELLDAPGRCARHRRAAGIDYSKMKRSNEGMYNTAAWRKLRKLKLEDSPRCEMCGRADGRLEAHHRVPPRGDGGLFFELENLMTLCAECHGYITRAESAERRRGKG